MRDDRTHHGIFQFARIAGPGVGGQRALGAFIELSWTFAIWRVQSEEVYRQQENVALAFAQGWKMDAQHSQPVVESDRNSPRRTISSSGVFVAPTIRASDRCCRAEPSG